MLRFRFMCSAALTGCIVMFTCGHWRPQPASLSTPGRKAKVKILQNYLEGVPDSVLQTPKQRLPDTIIIGTEKCGTGALVWFLNEHPLIRVPENAETFFFVGNQTYNRTYYRSLMPEAKDHEPVIEKTPAYFKTYGVPSMIKKVLPDAKIILLLCDPVNRTYSDFLQHVARHEIDNYFTFDELVVKVIKETTERYVQLPENVLTQYLFSADFNLAPSHIVTSGMYYYYVKHWLKWYELNKNFLILDGEEFLRKPWKTLNEVEGFLKIPNITMKEDFTQMSSGYYCMRTWRSEDSLKCLNKSKGRSRLSTAKWNPLPLRRFYTPYNERLFSFLSRRFDWQ